MTDPITVALYIGGGILVLFFARGLWILKKSGDARIERKKALVKAREGRKTEDAMTYEQELEREAIEKLRKIPLLRRIVKWLP